MDKGIKLTTYNEAINLIQNINIYLPHTVVPIENCLQKTVAKDVVAKVNLPLFNNSAMDGYGVKLMQLGQKIESKYHFTGGKVLDDVEAIVPIEDVEEIDNFIVVPNSLKPNQNIRACGEDVKENETILQKGQILNAGKIALLASQGITHISVYKDLSVTLLVIGDELKEHHEEIVNEEVYDSNTLYFTTRLKELGIDVNVLKSSDKKDELEKNIKEALKSNLVITTGGSSVGQRDLTKQIFNELGMNSLFNWVNIKPGKPVALGQINETYILNLPGNPYASAIVFEVFGKKLITRLLRHEEDNIVYISKISKDIKVKKTTFISGWFNGSSFTPNVKQGAGMVSIMANTNSYVVVEKDILKDDNIEVCVL